MGAAAAATLACGAEGEPLVSEGSRLEEIGAFDLGMLPDGTFSEERVFPADGRPEDLGSITVVASSEGRGRFALGVRDEGQNVLVDPARSEWSPNRSLSGRSLAVAQIPSATASLPLARNFGVTARWLSEPGADRTIGVRAFAKRFERGAGRSEIQALPLVVFLVGERPRDDASLARALGEARAIWRGGGVEIGEPPRLRLTGTEVETLVRLEIDRVLGSDSPAVGRLLRLSARSPDPRSLALFVVSDIVAGPGLDVWAVSGAIPVPPLPGTLRSGVILSGVVVEQDPVRAGQILAHELGHAMGLYHTTEGQLARMGPDRVPGAIHDQIDDTPACPAVADAKPADGVLSPEECREHDAGNLMFWAPLKKSTALTRGQGDMARRSAITR